MINDDVAVLKAIPVREDMILQIIEQAREYIREGHALRVLHMLDGLQDTGAEDWGAHWFEPVYVALKQELLAVVGEDCFYGLLQSRAREQFHDDMDTTEDHEEAVFVDAHTEPVCSNSTAVVDADEELPFFGGQSCSFGDDDSSIKPLGGNNDVIVVADDNAGGSGEPPAKRQRMMEQQQTGDDDVIVITSSHNAERDPFETSLYAAPPNRSLEHKQFSDANKELRRCMGNKTFTFSSCVHMHMSTWAQEAVKTLRASKKAPDTWITAAEAVEAMIAPAGLMGPKWDGELMAHNTPLHTMASEPHKLLDELLACVRRTARQKKNPWNEFFIGAHVKHFLSLRLLPHQVAEAMRLCHTHASAVCEKANSHTIDMFVYAATKQSIGSDLCVQVLDAVRRYPVLICIVKHMRPFFGIMAAGVLDRFPKLCTKWTAIDKQDASLVGSAFGLLELSGI